MELGRDWDVTRVAILKINYSGLCEFFYFYEKSAQVEIIFLAPLPLMLNN